MLSCELINSGTSAFKLSLKKLFYMSYGAFQCPWTYIASNSREVVETASREDRTQYTSARRVGVELLSIDIPDRHSPRPPSHLHRHQIWSLLFNLTAHDFYCKVYLNIAYSLLNPSTALFVFEII